MRREQGMPNRHIPKFRRETMITLRTGISFAASAGVIAVTAAAPTASAFAKDGMSSGKTVHCYGVNTCKGTSDCKTAKNDCKGQNSCKGMGFKAMTSKACTKAGGSLTAPN
jgi:hypothetical protein